MLILSLDSAGSACSVCLWQDKKIVALKIEKMERGQDQRLMPLIQNTLIEADIEFKALDRIAVTRGPGSFTGLRIGLASARGIGIALEKPVIGIDRFSIYKEQYECQSKDLLVAIASKRKELFCCFYPIKGASSEPNLMTREEIDVFLKDRNVSLIVGDADLPTLKGSIESEVITCATLAAKASQGDLAYLPRPLYLRPPDVTISHRTIPTLEQCID